MTFQPQPGQNAPAPFVDQERLRLESKIKNGKGSLWLIVVFSLVNLVASSFGLYFLFSAQLPLFVYEVARVLGSELAAEGGNASAVNIAGIVIAVLLLIPYLVVALLAKKHRGGMIAGLVLWSLDTLFCLYLLLQGASVLLDILFHAVGIVELVVALQASKKLAALPQVDGANAAPVAETNADTPV